MKDLLLKDLVWRGEHTDVGGDLRIRRGRIVELGRGLAPRRRELVLDLAHHRALPGLVNAHDHLPLNLLPHLGSPPYGSLADFAEEIYHPERSPIRQLERVSLADRWLWGGYKNLIAGATTVVHHDPLPRRIVAWRDFPVRVLRRFGWSHSLRFCENPAGAYAKSSGKPFIIHAAEGIDETSHQEIDQLDTLGMLAKNTVVVHGVALTASQRLRLVECGASLVWCPASNLRLFGVTAPVAELKGHLRIALGTDSTLTGSPTLLDEMRVALATGQASSEEILEMVTGAADRIFDLGTVGLGARPLAEGVVADLLVIADGGASAAASILAAQPADLVMVAVDGRVGLAWPAIAERLALGPPNIRLQGVPRWLRGDPASLRERIAVAAGEEVLTANPLWRMLQPL